MQFLMIPATKLINTARMLRDFSRCNHVLVWHDDGKVSAAHVGAGVPSPEGLACFSVDELAGQDIVGMKTQGTGFQLFTPSHKPGEYDLEIERARFRLVCEMREVRRRFPFFRKRARLHVRFPAILFDRESARVSGEVKTHEEALFWELANWWNTPGAIPLVISLPRETRETMARAGEMELQTGRKHDYRLN